jgi:hypothetical protein
LLKKMLYNAQRQRVRDWRTGQISTCPDCQRSLLARRGEVIIWHWAHFPTTTTPRAVCGHRETPWHLAWKTAYDDLPNWRVEAALHGFRVDAANFRTRNLREFIHCLSPYYVAKHHVLAALNFDIRWIFDGTVFVSGRRRDVAHGGVFGLLTPRAQALHDGLGQRCWVHWEERLWKEWRDRVWYPRTDAAAARLLAEFQFAYEAYPKPATTPASPRPNRGCGFQDYEGAALAEYDSQFDDEPEDESEDEEPDDKPQFEGGII